MGKFLVKLVSAVFPPLVLLTVFMAVADSLKPGFVSYFIDLRYFVALTAVLFFIWVVVDKKIDTYFSRSK